METLTELYTEKPRAAAIVGAALLDAALSEALLVYFPTEGRTRVELFDPIKGRLSETNIKTKLLYLLGAISKEAKANVEAIAEIRNCFAHNPEVRTFDHALVLTILPKLTLADTHVSPIADGGDAPPVTRRFYEGDLEKKRADPQQRFILCVRVLTFSLLDRAPETKPSPLRALI